MATVPQKPVAGYAYAHGEEGPVVVASIGATGEVFAGTFIARSGIESWDLIISIYTDRSGQLYAVYIGGDGTFPIKRTDPQNLVIHDEGADILGALSYDPSTGNFSISAPSVNAFWGTLMGTYAQS